MTIVISPHLDDAVLSLGSHLSQSPARIVTVFAGVPEEGCSDYDASCRFTSSRDAMKFRRAEDADACATLNCSVEHLDHFDNQYGQVRDGNLLIDQIREILTLGRHVFVPLGLGHPDHRFVTNAARQACTSGELILYEDLPYKVLWPEQVTPALDAYRHAGFDVSPHALEIGDPSMKRKAIECYRSQFPTADDPCLFVPERAWRATRCV